MDDLRDLREEYRNSVQKIQQRHDELIKILPTLRGKEYIRTCHRLDALQDNISNLTYGVRGMLRSAAGESDFLGETIRDVCADQSDQMEEG